MSRFNLARIWLYVASTAMILFGLLLVFFNQNPAFLAFCKPIHAVFWAGGQIPPDVAPFMEWVYATWGATIAGMGVMALLLVKHGFARRLRWTRDCLLAGVAFWYIFDTLASLQAGVVANAITNTVILVSFAVPIAFTWKEFTKTGDKRAHGKI